MNIKANLKQLKKQFKEHKEVLAGYGIENPDGLLKDSMMNTRDGDMAYAFFVRGQIEALKKLGCEATTGAKQL